MSTNQFKAFTAIMAVSSMAWTARAMPAVYKPSNSSARAVPLTYNSSNSSVTARDLGGYRNVAYFPDWSLGRYNIHDLPLWDLTHVAHAFAVADIAGNVRFLDNWAVNDRDMGDGTHGLLEAFFRLKTMNRNLKTLLSVGGFSNSDVFHQFAHTAKGRGRFVSSIMDIIIKNGMDGVDIDWEFPQNQDEGNAFVALLQELRGAMDAYANQHAHGYHFELTVAVSSSPWGTGNLNFPDMDSVLDAWHIMTYDFKGPWEQGASRVAGHHANLRNSHIPGVTSWSIEGAMQLFLGKHIPSKKIVLGMPMYGYTFYGTDGLGAPFSWASTEGSTYNQLPRPGATVYSDYEAGATYSYDPARKELVTYDTPKSIRWKAEYVKSLNLGGAMWWEVTTDKRGDESLVKSVSDALNHNWQRKDNLLCFPHGRFAALHAHC